MATFIQIFLLGLFLSDIATAAPEYVSASQARFLVGRPRSSIVVAFNTGTALKPNIRLAHPVMIPMNRDGQMIWFTGDDWKRQSVDEFDRLAIEKDMLGRPISGLFEYPGCLPTNGIPVTTSQGVGWLVSCRDEVTSSIDVRSTRVTYRENSSEVYSKYYSYKFKKENHMLFEELTLKGNQDKVVARDSDLYIKSDVRNFFTLNFSSADIESKIMASRVEPMVALASLGFYLKVLFFKITLDLRTDAAFFESSANIPMIITLPVNAKKRLHPKSGVLYSFLPGDGVEVNDIKTDMPRLVPQRLSGEYISEGLSRCQKVCAFELLVPSGEKTLKLKLSINRSLVEKGLFPWFVPDVSAVTDGMEWSFRRGFDPKKRIGIYLEMSGLPEGSHPWDFWIGF